MITILDFFKSTPVILSAALTASITLIGILINLIIFFIKSRQEIRNEYTLILKDKLEKAYSPLITHFISSSNEKFIVNSDFLGIVNNNGHLFSVGITDDLRALIQLERSMSASTYNKNLEQEHHHLCDKIIYELRKDFNELQDLYNRDFHSFKFKNSRKWYHSAFDIFCKASIFLTLIFYILLSIDIIFNNINGKTSNPTSTNILMTAYAVIIAGTTFAIIILSFGSFIDKIFGWYKRKQGLYKIGDIVPTTDMYVCRICNKSQRFVKYQRFCLCKDHKGFKHFIKSILFDFVWISKKNSATHKRIKKMILK